jgi:hypothetical protein
MGVSNDNAISLQNWNALFTLLNTSTSLHKLEILFGMDCVDAFMTAFSRYLLGSASLLHLNVTVTDSSLLPEATFISLCDIVSQSSLRKFSMNCDFAMQVNLEAVAERLARAIAESLLDEVEVENRMRLALSSTPPARN